MYCRRWGNNVGRDSWPAKSVLALDWSDKLISNYELIIGWPGHNPKQQPYLSEALQDLPQGAVGECVVGSLIYESPCNYPSTVQKKKKEYYKICCELLRYAASRLQKYSMIPFADSVYDINHILIG